MAKSKKKNKGSNKNAPKLVSKKAPIVAKTGFFSDKKALLFLGIALLLTFLVHMGNFQNTWVNWDDDKNFQENELVTNITGETFWENTGKIFTTDVIGGYNPLSIWTFAIESMVWGMDDDSWKWWHMDNLLLHMLVVFFVFLIGRQLKLNIYATCLLAILFGIHPMRVESVAWLTERKDVLFASFYFAALYFYIKGKLKGNEWKYVFLIIPLAILSGLSKIQAVSLPLSMIAIDYYMDKKFDLYSMLNKWPYFLISLIVGLYGSYMLSKSGVILDSSNEFTAGNRLVFGLYAYVQYIGKLVYPWVMSPLYPYPSKFASSYLVGPVLFLLMGAGTFVAWRKKAYVWVFGMAFYTVNIVFVLQIVGAGQGLFADRFTYVPYFGLFFIAAYYFDKLDFKNMIGKVVLGIVAAYLILLSFMTYKQTQIWINSYSMWSHVIEYYPKTKVTWGNRANWLRDNGYKAQALADYTERLRLGADDPEPFNSRGKLYFQSQSRDTLLLAMADYKDAVKLADFKKKTTELKAEYRVNLASTYARLGMHQEAINMFDEAQTFNSKNPNVYFNRSITYHQIGDYSGEKKDILEYLKIKPRDGAMISNLGTAKRLLGDPASAEADFNRALKYNKMPAIYMERARNYIALGKLAEARNDVKILQQNNLQVPGDILQATGM